MGREEGSMGRVEGMVGRNEGALWELKKMWVGKMRC